MMHGDEEANRRQAPLANALGERTFSQAGEVVDRRAVWQLTSMSVGAGIFTIPKIFVTLGPVHAALWVTFMGLLANLAMQRLLDAAEMYDSQSYEVLAERAFGPCGKLGMVFITLISTLIATLSYVNKAKDLLLNATVAFILDVDVNSQPVEILNEGKTFAILALLVTILLPAMLATSLGQSAWISRLCVVTVFGSATFFILRCCVVLAQQDWKISNVPAFAGDFGDILVNMATLAFSYSMVYAVFPVLEERCAVLPIGVVVQSLRKPVQLSVGLCIMIYLAVGFAGSFAFGENTKDFSLENLPLSEPLTQLITLVMGFSVFMLVAIVVFPCVQSLMFLVTWACGESAGCLRPVVVLLLGAAIVCTDAFLQPTVTFALCGSLGLSLGAYVMPCGIFFSLARSMAEIGLRVTKTRRFLTAIVLLFGLLLLFGSTPVTLQRAMTSTSTKNEPLRKVLCGGGLGGADAGTQTDQADKKCGPRLAEAVSQVFSARQSLEDCAADDPEHAALREEVNKEFEAVDQLWSARQWLSQSHSRGKSSD